MAVGVLSSASMLGEWFTYLTTPCPRYLREMGYLRELVGVRSRFRRCRGPWANHLDNCRKLIIEAAGACRRRRRAVILGSGFLYDIPLAELSSLFEDVVLVDLLHPRAARRLGRRYANVVFVEHDVIGVLSALHVVVERGGETLPRPDLGSLPGEDADLMVSANLLSQLSLLPRMYLERRGFSEGIDEFSRALVQCHLSDLAAFPGIACLITDVERLTLEDDEVIASEDPLFGVPLPYRGREWVWNIAPRPEVHRHRDYRHRVLGVVDLTTAYARYASDLRNTTRAAP
jgi:hypothetical protein